MRRVVITGMGTINPLANNVEQTFEAMKAGTSGISYLADEIREELKVNVAGQIKGYDPLAYFNRKEARTLDKAAQFAMIAANEAAKSANLDQITDRDRIGVNVTSGIGGISSIQEESDRAKGVSYKRVSPMFIPKALINLVPGNIAIAHDCHGICNSVVTACASSTDAIGHAYNYIQSSMVDVMMTGGSEASICQMALSGFNNMRALTRTDDLSGASIPFDENRSGFVMGEGAAVLILEEYEHAKKRGAKIYGEIVGYGATCDANHITAPDPEGVYVTKAINSALKMADVSIDEIGFVNVHGTSTPLNDKTEAHVLSNLKKQMAVTSSKSMTGHLLGAAGAIEVLNVAMSLNDNVITPTINTKQIDEAASDLNVITELTESKSEYAMSTSLGFGGHNAAVIVKRVEE